MAFKRSILEFTKSKNKHHNYYNTVIPASL